MAIIFTQVMPKGVPLDMIDAVTDAMGVKTDPPQGMVVHTHWVQDGQVHIMDVWESAADHDAFVETLLMPTMGKVAADRGFDIAAAGPPTMTTTEVLTLVRGA